MHHGVHWNVDKQVLNNIFLLFHLLFMHWTAIVDSEVRVVAVPPRLRVGTPTWGVKVPVKSSYWERWISNLWVWMEHINTTNLFCEIGQLWLPKICGFQQKASAPPECSVFQPQDIKHIVLTNHVKFQTIFQQYFTVHSSRSQGRGQGLWKQVIGLCFPLQQQQNHEKKMCGIFVLIYLMP